MTTCQMQETIESLVQQAAARAPELEVWPDHYRLRGRELEMLLEECPVPVCQRILEVGCGNGLAAALFAKFADEVIATDLLDGNPETASQGLDAPRRLMASLGVTNCTLLACSAEAIPLASESVDLIFSGYTLEHVPHPARAVQEMRRVLRPGGWLYLILPTSMERITYFPVFYQYLARRAWWYATKSRGPRGSRTDHLQDSHRESLAAGLAGAADAPMTWQRFRALHPHFPWPEPHGAYAHYLQEILTYHPWRWKRLVECNGFRIMKRFTTILFPWHLVGLVTEPFPWFVRWSRVSRRWQQWPLLRSLGHNVCIVAQKV